MRELLRLILVGLLLPTVVNAQARIGSGKAKELFNELCSSCHGKDLRSGQGGSLIDGNWKLVGKTISFENYVKNGDALTGMPAFGDRLDAKQTRSLEIYIEEMSQLAHKKPVTAQAEDENRIYETDGVRFRLETVIDGLKLPWSIAFHSNGSGLVTERGGKLRMFRNGKLMPPVQGLTGIWAQGQGGLMEVALHPDYETNRWVYLAYSQSVESKTGMTRVVRGRIRENRWVDEEVIFETDPEFHSKKGVHFGTRFVFQDGYLFFGIGDRGSQDEAQDLSRPNGKIHRIHDDGRVPRDNPFVNQEGAYPTIWAYGVRNPQGMDLHPQTGEIWESEHGPRGGDEINVIEGGKNYGWPVITFGMNYSGTPITGATSAPGMEQPRHYWTPSIAVCGIDFYEGDMIPAWKNSLMVGGLRSLELHRLEIQEGIVTQNEIVLSGAGRVRDVASGPDGYLYLVLNGPDRIVRLVPVP